MSAEAQSFLRLRLRLRLRFLRLPALLVLEPLRLELCVVLVPGRLRDLPGLVQLHHAILWVRYLVAWGYIRLHQSVLQKSDREKPSHGTSTIAVRALYSTLFYFTLLCATLRRAR